MEWQKGDGREILLMKGAKMALAWKKKRGNRGLVGVPIDWAYSETRYWVSGKC